MLKLYYMPGVCSTASHIGLEESGAAYELAPISFANNEQRTPEYLKINPRGRVPAAGSPRISCPSMRSSARGRSR